MVWLLLSTTLSLYPQEPAADRVEGAAASEDQVESTRAVTDETTLRFDATDDDEIRAGGETDEIQAFGAGDLIRMVLVLLMVVGAVYGVISLLRRRVIAPDDTESPIRVLATRSLGGGRELHAVMIGKQVLLLGGGESSLQLISTVDDQETIDELVLAHSATKPPARTFGAVLGGWLNNLAVPGSSTAATAGGPAAPHMQAQSDRLRRLR